MTRLTIGVWMLVLTAALLPGQIAHLQTQRITYPLSSGELINSLFTTAEVWNQTICVPGADAVQAAFSLVELGSDGDRLVITSLQDYDAQEFDRTTIVAWANHTAWFNGPVINLSLRLAPGSTGRVDLAELVGTNPGSGPDTLCGSDDRTASTDNRNFRLMITTAAGTGVCTGWLIASNAAFLTAGHCWDGGPVTAAVGQFHVPASSSSGGTNNPPAADQYNVDLNSISRNSGGQGNDWLAGRLNSNSSGNPASQHGFYSLATAIPAVNTTLRVTGYGSDTSPNTANYTQQTSTGPLFQVAGSRLDHRVDSMPGNSGSPILDNASDNGIGIHTHGGCDATANSSNAGTSILLAALQTAIYITSHCATYTLSAGSPQSLTCTPVGFTLTPSSTSWNVLGVSSPSDWDISAAGVSSTWGSSTCDFLVANGNLGNPGATTGETFRFSGSDNATLEFRTALTVPIGSNAGYTFGASSILQLFQFNVTTAGTYNLSVHGNTSLGWRLFSPGAGAGWRSRSDGTNVASGTVGGATVNVSLSTGWHGLVVYRDGGPIGASGSNLWIAIGSGSVSSIALTQGTAVSVTATCQPFTITPNAGNWNCVAVSSTADWDLLMGTAGSRYGGGACDFVVANGTGGAISYTNGLFQCFSGTTSATGEHATVVSQSSDGTPYMSSINAGHIVRLHQFYVGTAGNHVFSIPGDPSLTWVLFAPGADALWRDRGAYTATGTVGSTPTTLSLGTGWHALVVCTGGGAAPATVSYTVAIGPSVASIALNPSFNATTITSNLQPFTTTPTAGKWNAVGVTSTSDWDLHLGPAMSESGTGTCDFVAADGHQGTISPTAGAICRYSGANNAAGCAAITTNLTVGGPYYPSWATTEVIRIFEFNVTTANVYDLNLTGGIAGLNWHLFKPAASTAWRDRSTADLTRAVGTSVTGYSLAVGWHALVITKDNGTGTSANYVVSVTETNHAAPTLNSISPSSTTAGSAGFVLTANGSGFVPESIVRWSGTNLVTTCVSAGQLTASVPSAYVAAAGTATVTVYSPSPGGGTSVGRTFTVNNPVPALSALSPTSQTAGGGAFTLVCTGSNFNSQSVVRWNGGNLTTTPVSGTQVNASVTAALIAAAGTATVTVFNPTPAGGTSSGLTFTINNPVPSLAFISPTTRTAGGAAFTLTCNGSNYNSQSIIRWNGGNLATTLVNTSQITASVSAASIAAAGTATVTVFNPTPGGGTTAGQTLTISNPGPTLTSISPTTRTAGGAAFTLTCTGTNYNSQSIARWNGTNLTTTLVSPTQVTASVPAASIVNAGTASVTVFNPAPGGGLSGSQTLTINNPLPVLTSISPTSISAGSGAFTLGCSGSGFTPQSFVRWDGSNLPTTFSSSTYLTASVAAALVATTGSASVMVFNPTPGGGLSASLTFTIDPQSSGLTIGSVLPPSIPIMSPGSSTMTLMLTGTGFDTTSMVYADAQELPTMFQSSTTVLAIIGPAHPRTLVLGGIALSVLNQGSLLSNTVGLPVGTGTNRGTINRSPPNPSPGSFFDLRVEGGRPWELFTLIADFANLPPLANIGAPTENLVLGVFPPAWIPLFDGLGVFGPASGLSLTYDPNGTPPGGVFVVPGLPEPNPPVGIPVTLQAVYADPSSPLGIRLTWARRITDL